MSSDPPLRLGLAGAGGRMGLAIAELARERGDVVIAATLGRAGGAARREAALAVCDVLIDVSTGSAAAELAQTAAARGGPALVIGATGFSAAESDAIDEAARRIAIVRSGNFSLGVALLSALVEQAAARLPASEWDIEILDIHHRRKLDAPSGTALMLGEAAAAGRRQFLAAHVVRGRDGLSGERPDGAIGFASLRAGGVVGEHSVILAAEDEVVTLSHSARDRRLFARGALAAALWVAGKPPGLYDMRAVLGI